MILGHAHPAVLESVEKAARDGLSFGAATAREVEMAELICAMVPSIEMVRMVNSMLMKRKAMASKRTLMTHNMMAGFHPNE